MSAHRWVGPRPPIVYVHCEVCGVIKSIGKLNGPCKGRTKMRPMEKPVGRRPVIY